MTYIFQEVVIYKDITTRVCYVTPAYPEVIQKKAVVLKTIDCVHEVIEDSPEDSQEWQL